MSETYVFAAAHAPLLTRPGTVAVSGFLVLRRLSRQNGTGISPRIITP